MDIYYRDWLTGLWWQRRLSAGCRNQKAAGVIQSESEGLRLGGRWYNFLPKAQEPGIWMAQGQEKMWHSPGRVLERVALHLSSRCFRSGMEHRSPALQSESLQPGPPWKPKGRYNPPLRFCSIQPLNGLGDATLMRKICFFSVHQS